MEALGFPEHSRFLLLLSFQNGLRKPTWCSKEVEKETVKKVVSPHRAVCRNPRGKTGGALHGPRCAKVVFKARAPLPGNPYKPGKKGAERESGGKAPLLAFHERIPSINASLPWRRRGRDVLLEGKWQRGRCQECGCKEILSKE